MIEVLIAMAIMGIVAAFSLNVYSEHVARIRRFEAATYLSKLAIAMEKYHLEQQTYQGATLAALHFAERIIKNKYRLIIQQATTDHYLLVAEPQGAQAKQELACGSLTLNANNEHGVTGNASVDECW